MAHYTLIARINADDGKFPFVNVQFSRNHRPIPIEGATYYLRPGNRGSRTPIRIGKDLSAAIAALLNMEDCKALNNIAVLPTVRASVVPATVPRKTIAEAAREYIERSRQKSRKTFIGYRTAVNLFVQSCKKTYFDDIIETLRQELGHSDISTTQIYLRSADRKSDKHRARSMRLTSSRCGPQADSLSAAGLRKPPSNCRFGYPPN